MTIGQDLDEQFIKIAQRIGILEDNQNEFAFNADIKAVRRDVGDLNHEVGQAACHETLVGIEADLTSQIEQLQERIDGLDFDDLESASEDVRDSVSYNDDRIDEIEAYKVTEEEVEYLLDSRLDDKISDYVNDCVCEEINSRAVGFTEWTVLRDRVKELERFFENPNESLILDKVHDCVCAETEVLCRRVKELEDRLNKPSITARIMRWLREGPSIKEVATNWYAGIRRGS